MDPKQAYKHCLRCGGNLKLKEVLSEGYLQCLKCQFKVFINVSLASGAVIENEKGEILLIKRKFNPEQGKWDIPGGFVNPGETLNQSIIRELEEELKVQVSVSEIIDIYPDDYLYQGISIPLMCVIAKATIIQGVITPSDDAEEFKYFPKSEIADLDLAFLGLSQSIKNYAKKSSN